MTKAIVLQHADHEDAGALGVMLTQRGLRIDTRLLHHGAPIPGPDEGALWVVMGGPMGIGDIGESPYPFLAPEVAALRERLERRLPILGICLGAQLIAHASGAGVYPNTRAPAPSEAPARVREVGWGAVQLLGPRQEPARRGLGRELLTLHWHGDTFDLPVGAVHLASSPLCHHQAFRIGHHVYALQFHPEVAGSQARRWAELDAEFVRAARGPLGIGLLLAETRRCADRASRLGIQLLENILSDLGFPARAMAAAGERRASQWRCPKNEPSIAQLHDVSHI